MEIVISPKAHADLEQWQRAGKTALLKKVRTLLEAIAQDPYKGIGKPEMLKHGLSGRWSRRIDKEHRLTYRIDEATITILSLRDHYE